MDGRPNPFVPLLVTDPWMVTPDKTHVVHFFFPQVERDEEKEVEDVGYLFTTTTQRRPKVSFYFFQYMR